MPSLASTMYPPVEIYQEPKPQVVQVQHHDSFAEQAMQFMMLQSLFGNNNNYSGGYHQAPTHTTIVHRNVVVNRNIKPMASTPMKSLRPQPKVNKPVVKPEIKPILAKAPSIFKAQSTSTSKVSSLIDRVKTTPKSTSNPVLKANFVRNISSTPSVSRPISRPSFSFSSSSSRPSSSFRSSSFSGSSFRSSSFRSR